ERCAGLDFELFCLGAVFPLCHAVASLDLVAVCTRDLPFQSAELTIEQAHARHGLIQPFRQAVALRAGKAKIADGAGNLDDLAPELPGPPAIVSYFLAGQLGRQPSDCLVKIVYLLDTVTELLGSVLQHLFGDLILIEGDDVLDGTGATFEIIANSQNLLNHKG